MQQEFAFAGNAIRFHREFAMPNGDTLSIKPIYDWSVSWVRLGTLSVDPFARNCTIADLRNDLNPDTLAEHHMDAEAFCKMLRDQGVRPDVAIFDPPYSPRQISELYKSVGLEVDMKTTQNAALYKRVRDALDEIIPVGGVVLSYGWNSNGMGLKRGYAVEDILMVRHGGGHNDTICMAEQKL